MMEVIRVNSKDNDALRASIPHIRPPNALFITQGIAALMMEEVSKILRKVKDFNAFTEDNDPYGEHDMGSFNHNGKRIMWKIDDYDGCEGLSLVLTVMPAEEY